MTAEPSPSMSMVDWALAYAQIGFWVHPVHSVRMGRCSCGKKDCENPGKHPRTKNGFKDATVDEAAIRAWWEVWPSANIGIATGASGLVCVDVDPRHGGDESWGDLKPSKVDLDTAISLTGGQGNHIIYKEGQLPIPSYVGSERMASPLGPGVDVRARGGYFIAPPSTHVSGNEYAWEQSPWEFPPLYLPDWLEAKLAVGERKQGAPLSAAGMLDGVPDGARNDSIFRLASKMRRLDLPLDVAYDIAGRISDAANPPYEHRDAFKAVDSAYGRYAPSGDAYEDRTEQAPEEMFIDWPVFWAADQDDRQWMAEPLLPAGRMVSLYAPAKQGKSLLALWIAAKVATGEHFLGESRQAPRHVLYLDFEMTEDDVRERLENMGYGPGTDFSHFHYALLPSLPPFDTALGGKAILDMAELVGAEMVVIDTLSRVLKGEENEADTVRAFSMHTGRPLKQAGRTVLRVDHAGKDLEKGQRGTSAKNDDADVVWQLTRQDENTIKLKATHRRQSWIPEVITLALTEEPLGYREVDDSWPAGTTEMAAVMEELGIPLEWTRRQVRDALKAAGKKGRDTIIGAAMRWRKNGNQSGEPTISYTGNHISGTTGTRGDFESGTKPGTNGNQGRGKWEPQRFSVREPLVPSPPKMEEIDDGLDI